MCFAFIITNYSLNLPHYLCAKYMFKSFKSPSFYLFVALLYLQYVTWFGWGGWLMISEMEKDVLQAQHRNTVLKSNNDVIKQQIEDLKQGDSSLEDIARIKLGMIKSDEILVRPKN
jgi:cell division protein FtsB